mmetsp:Transcript_21061/g.31804  ORF Transcript_21061/g.31804 Transcript_21061/m.31804 type:complete len:87 (+) Transcript_21061:779-1039(+)
MPTDSVQPIQDDSLKHAVINNIAITPNFEPEPIHKRKGRPKGSRDKKKRASLSGCVKTRTATIQNAQEDTTASTASITLMVDCWLG